MVRMLILKIQAQYLENLKMHKLNLKMKRKLNIGIQNLYSGLLKMEKLAEK